jgi:hypothetical protein
MVPTGLVMLVLGFRRGAAGMRRHHRDPPRALALLRGFRISIVGLCLAGVGAGLLWDVGWLVALSLIIGGEELFESTIVITAMTHPLPPPSAPVRMPYESAAVSKDRLGVSSSRPMVLNPAPPRNAR